MENSSTVYRELLGFTGSDRSTDDRESDTYAAGSTTGEWIPSSLPSQSDSASHSSSDSASQSASNSSFHSFLPSITTDDFSEVTTEDFRSNTYSIVAYRVVWFVLAITLVMLLTVAVVTLIVRCRHVLARRRPNESNNPVTFRFTRSSNLILDKKEKSKPSPTSGREGLNNDLEVPASAGKGNSGTQCAASEGDLYEKDSDCGSWHLECTTFSAVNDNFDDNTLNRQ